MPATVWPIEPRGAADILESYGYLTDVIPSYEAGESRQQLRSVPVVRLENDLLLGSARESSLAANLIFGLQDELVTVPLWQYASHLTAALAPGGQFITIPDAHLVPYIPGGYAMLWTDPFTYELLQIAFAEPDGSGLWVESGSVPGWPAGSLIVPTMEGRIDPRSVIRRESSSVSTGRIVASYEATAIRPKAIRPVATDYAASWLPSDGTSPLWKLVDEPVADDSDFISVDLGDIATQERVQLRLRTAPQQGFINFTFSFRHRRVGATVRTIEAQLFNLDSGTVLSTLNETAPGTSWGLKSTTASINFGRAINGYHNLQTRIRWTGAAGTPGDKNQVSQITVRFN